MSPTHPTSLLMKFSPLLLASSIFANDISDWLGVQVPFSHVRIKDHIEASGALTAGIGSGYPFAVADSYQRFWVRDGGISMMALAEYYASNPSKDIEAKFDAFLSWTKEVQASGRADTANYPEKMGWTRFFLDTGLPDHGWMSPQFDGLGFRTLALMHYADEKKIQRQVYSANDSTTVVKSDLDTICDAYAFKTGFEPWEEIQGDHFVVNQIHHKALVTGADFVRKLGDYANAARYTKVAATIAAGLDRFATNGKWIVSTLNGVNGGENQGSSAKIQAGNFLDLSSIIGLVFQDNSRPDFSITSAKSQGTFMGMVDSFLNGKYAPALKLSSWALNKQTCTSKGYPLNPAVGRYPEDIYDGFGYVYDNSSIVGSHGAGFWYLATNYFGEYLFKTILAYEKSGSIKIDASNAAFFAFLGVNTTPRTVEKYSWRYIEYRDILAKLFLNGEAFLRRTMDSLPSSPKPSFMSEQFHYLTGSQISTADLTWSYASVISAAAARDAASRSVKLFGYLPSTPRCKASVARPACPIIGALNASSDPLVARAYHAETCFAAKGCWVTTATGGTCFSVKGSLPDGGDLYPPPVTVYEKVSFAITHAASADTTMYAVGAFNGWDPCQALKAQVGAGNVWTTPQIDLGLNKTYQWKPVEITGALGCKSPNWFPGGNAEFTVAAGAQVVSFTW